MNKFTYLNITNENKATVENKIFFLNDFSKTFD